MTVELWSVTAHGTRKQSLVQCFEEQLAARLNPFDAGKPYKML